jgi:hypothetical protein
MRRNFNRSFRNLVLLVRNHNINSGMQLKMVESVGVLEFGVFVFFKHVLCNFIYIPVKTGYNLINSTF